MKKSRQVRIISRHFKGGGGDVSETVPEWAVPYIKNVGNQTEGHYNAGNLGRVAGVNPNLQAAFGGGARAIADTTSAGVSTLQNQSGILSDSQERLSGLATSGGFNPEGLRQKAIDEAKAASASDVASFSQSGTLGSARQAVRAGAREAALAGALGEVDLRANDMNFRNRLAAEGGLGSAAGVQSNLATTGTGLATNAAKSLAALGTSERSIEQSNADQDWQALSRYSSTIFGNPARQQATPGGK